ncbi:hypothetical protein DFJ58DRAFT_712347 [Suillus subalutaceus]|uniref:uncharacterized protein n=1 Tax=Suillus subalutaceus TaxID=48586 RepID=UPI001B85C2E1|nr:uncharacterized protein DFJ58DRAFT_712347 [Suillus subalutaceus]KAG1877638.1 hypothetical protein DFJ58DRAFT_712347 [Suillus subalutaceus]
MEMSCHYCVVERHKNNPLHIIKEWNGSFFQRTHLKSLGLRVQLGHTPGDHCYNPRPSAGNDFVVVDVNGIHEVVLDFSTTTDPQTAATFNILKHYHLLSYESKVSAYKFYHSLSRRSDNTGLSPVRDHYSAFMRTVHEWRHLRQLRCGGRGHDPGGIAETKAGELAVLCPACPHPDKNLPHGWENSPPATRWLYALFVAIDANFRLKRKTVSSDQVDPGLNAGWAYFVEDAYKSYLSEQANERQERSTCVSHNAVNMADTKSSQGLAATGIGTINCARHKFKLPNGVGDLQKGERYLNMDYLVFSALVGFTVTMLNISYDIACQWSKKLWSRMEHMLARLHIPHDDILVRYFIPKFHIAAHIAACQTDGEAPQQCWANANHDHFGDWNWKKTAALGHTLKRKMEEAVKWEREHHIALYDLEGTIQPALLGEWGIEVEMWEEDSTHPNPFETITQAAVRSQLAELEAQELQAGIDHSLNDDVSPSVLISGRIELEDMQQQLKHDISNLSFHPTDKQREAIIHRTNVLQRRVSDSWSRYQQLYMPIVSMLRSSTNNLPLYLPSALEHFDCDHCLMQYEWELWQAQACDALNELHSHLHLHSHMYKFKDKNLRGQNLIGCVEAKKDAVVKKYKRARQAMASLSCRLGDHTQGTGTISWIWLTVSVYSQCDQWLTQIGVRIEWCKARARTAQWSEEVELLAEEMRQVLAFLEWQSGWWHQRTTLRSFEKTTEQEGLQAYVYHQAAPHEPEFILGIGVYGG